VIDAEEIQEALELEPWLRWYLDDADETLDDTRVRFIVAQNIAIRELRAHNETIEIRVERGDLLTTCYIAEYAHERGDR